MFDPTEVEELNSEIAKWDEENKTDVVNEMNALGITHYPYSRNSKPLQEAFKSALRKKFDLVDRISYCMPRSAIFVHKGVSRGHGKDNPRTIKEFFNPVVDRNIEKLADIVAEGQGNLVVNNINIR